MFFFCHFHTFKIFIIRILFFLNIFGKIVIFIIFLVGKDPLSLKWKEGAIRWTKSVEAHNYYQA